jgi:hypothetical protein
VSDLTLYIPTYRRLDKQITWDRLSPSWQKRAFLVADEDEVAPLRARGYRVLNYSGPQGIAPKRQWIMDQHDTELLGDVVVMMDDDFSFAQRRSDEPTKFAQIRDAATFDAMMSDFAHMMDFCVLGCVANRSGANYNLAPYLMNARLNGLFAVNVTVAREEGIRIDRLPFMEEFDMTLQFLTRGYRTLALNTYCKNDQGGGNAPGGCSTYRDLEGQAAAARTLAQLFPDFVTVTERPGWNGGMSGPRSDVRVAWARAYKAGREGRDLIGRPQERDVTWALGDLEWAS